MRNKGFTLLELLVVIGIIGIMMALATVAYSTTQRSGRDSRRKQDLVAIQNGLEQYYSATTGIFKYPDGNCGTAISGILKSNVPKDPGTGIDYYGMDVCSSTNTPNYCICAQMEGSSAGNSSTTSCGWSTGGAYYCVSNLQ